MQNVISEKGHFIEFDVATVRLVVSSIIHPLVITTFPLTNSCSFPLGILPSFGLSNTTFSAYFFYLVSIGIRVLFCIIIFKVMCVACHGQIE